MPTDGCRQTEGTTVMDVKTLLNRGKTRFRNWLASDLAIKKLIPAALRHRVSGKVMGALETHTGIPGPYLPGKYPKGINLYGFFKAENGLSQGVRMYARALEEGKIPHTFLNTDFLDWLPQEDTTFDDRLETENKYAVNVVHVNPDQWQQACGMFPRSHFDGHYNIGVWLWELDTAPKDWEPMYAYVDEIWAPSAFIADALEKATNKPVTVIPYGMETPYDEKLTRADFGLAEEDFLVLMMYDSNSYASRKNPGASIDAFREAFGEKPEGVKLVIKISNPKKEDINFVQSRLDSDSYILLTERMDRRRMNSLIRLCDVFITLHRSEGFGLVPAEAMSLGTATVATNWSANTEFMPEGTACLVNCSQIPVGRDYRYEQEGITWADPDVHEAAAWLRRLKEEPEFREKTAKTGQDHIRKQLNPARCAEQIAARLNEIIAD